jgi:predicted dehydrogenase
MTEKEIHVGIVGASAKSRATVSHVPAITGLPGLKLAAVARRNEQSAREAAEAFGADRWFSDPATQSQLPKRLSARNRECRFSLLICCCA